jgi:hypothetical protein
MEQTNKQLLGRQIQYINRVQSFLSQSLDDLEQSHFDREELDKSLALCQLFKQSVETLHTINRLELPLEFLGDESECAEGIRDDNYTYKSDIRDRLHQAIVWNGQPKSK